MLPRGELYESIFHGALADLRSSPEMSRWHVDNLMTHIAAAALIVDDFEVDVNDLRDDLKLENKEYVDSGLVYGTYANTAQDQAILCRARLQTRSTNTGRPHTHEAHQS